MLLANRENEAGNRGALPLGQVEGAEHKALNALFGPHFCDNNIFLLFLLIKLHSFLQNAMYCQGSFLENCVRYPHLLKAEFFAVLEAGFKKRFLNGGIAKVIHSSAMVLGGRCSVFARKIAKTIVFDGYRA